jgi:hypothetical protein
VNKRKEPTGIGRLWRWLVKVTKGLGELSGNSRRFDHFVDVTKMV